MATNHLKIITASLDDIEAAINDFFKWCEQTGYNIQNTKYHVKEDQVMAFIQYRAKL